MHSLTNDQIALLQRAMFGDALDGPLSDSDKANIERHTMGRLEEFRETFIPWLADNMNLAMTRVLEIGAGTGASSVSRAERGATVHGIDIDAKLLSIAEMRSRFHNLHNVSFEVMNATEIGRLKSNFDLIIFFATLEHMTHTERLSALKTAWQMLPLGGFLAIVEAPNRLWYYDNHTTLMNYYQWLPDDVAIDYAKFVGRDAFRESMEVKMPREEKLVSLARWGRGASYHEIEIAIGAVDRLNVRDGMDDFRRRQQPDLDDYWERSADAVYRNAIRAVEPRLQSAFFYPWLNVLIQK